MKASPTYRHRIMQGVTTAIVAFIFAGVIWPHLIRHRVQFFGGLVAVIVIILMDTLAHIFTSAQSPLYAVIGLLQIAALVLLVMSTGMSARALGGEMLNTIDVVRRGGEKETIIVPLTGEQPKPRQPRAETRPGGRVDLTRDIAAEEAALDTAETKLATPPAKPSKPADTSIPLE
jgi:hypothetical protein